MTSNKDIFTTLIKEENDEIIILRDNKEHQAKGSGSIEIQMDNIKKRIVDNILYVPRLRRIFFFINQITREKDNLIVEFNASKCLIKDIYQRYKVIIQGIEEDGMYTLDISKKLQQSLNTYVNNEGQLWRERYGHINF